MRQAFTPDAPSDVRQGNLTIDQEFSSDAIESTAEKLVPLLASGRHHDLAHIVEVAQLLNDGYTPLATRRGGQPTIPIAEFCDVLERQLSVEPLFLARCLRLLDVYGEEVVERFAAVPAISASHLFALARIADNDLRDELEECVISERWTVSQLEREIRRRYGRQRAAGGGRKPLVPRSVKAALSNIAGIATTFANRSASVWFGQAFNAEKEIREMPSDTFDRAFLEQLRDTKTACQGVKEAAERDITALDAMEAHVEQCLALYEEEPALAGA